PGFRVHRMGSRFGPSSPRTENWPSEARRAAFGLERNFVSTISSDATTRLLQTRLRDRTPLEHDAISRRDREHVRGHRLDFRVGDLDEIEPVFPEELPKRNPHQTRIDDPEVLIQEADERHQVHARLRTLDAREANRHGLAPD